MYFITLCSLISHYTVVRIEIDRNLTNFTLREGSSDPAKLCASVVDPDPNCPIGFDTRVAFLTDGSSAGMFISSRISDTIVLRYYYRAVRGLWSNQSCGGNQGVSTYGVCRHDPLR